MPPIIIPTKLRCPHPAPVVASVPALVKHKPNGKPAHAVATLRCPDCGLSWRENT